MKTTVFIVSVTFLPSNVPRFNITQVKCRDVLTLNVLHINTGWRTPFIYIIIKMTSTTSWLRIHKSEKSFLSKWAERAPKEEIELCQILHIMWNDNKLKYWFWLIELLPLCMHQGTSPMPYPQDTAPVYSGIGWIWVWIHSQRRNFNGSFLFLLLKIVYHVSHSVVSPCKLERWF